MTVKIVIFSMLGLLIFIKFRKELGSFSSHGIYMFFAFESLLALFFLNIGFFFHSGFSWYQVLAWLLLIASLLFALSGFYGLKRYGKPIDDWENTTHLISQGIFRYIRHPLYSSLILLNFGIFLKNVTLLSAIACLVSTGFLLTASKVEEKENHAKFGSAYEEYVMKTKHYFPFIF